MAFVIPTIHKKRQEQVRDLSNDRIIDLRREEVG